MYSMKIKCPHCLDQVHLTIQNVTEYVSRVPVGVNILSPNQAVSIRTISSTSPITAYSTAICPECNGPLMMTFRCQASELRDIQKATKDNSWVITGIVPKTLTVYPELKEPDDSPYYPEKIRAPFIELQEDILMKRTAPRIVVGCRSVLEVALKSLGYDKGNLLSRIDKARDDGILTESMKNWAHRIRMNGNEAVHELEANQNEAEEFVSFLRLFLEVSFVLPKRISQAQLDT